MKLYFDHMAGRITHADWQYTPVTATFSPNEYKEALENGWLLNEWEPPYWFQARQVRYHLPALKEAKRRNYPERISFSFRSPLFSDLSDLEEIWSKYLDAKGFKKTEDFKSSLDLDPKDKVILEIYDYDQLVAFSIIRLRPAPVSLQFAWSYHEPKLSLGILSQRFEMDYLFSQGYEYHYVCPGYEKTCIWKSRFPGFEFWTGTYWSTDKKLYEKLCLQDSDLEGVDELFRLKSIVEGRRAKVADWSLL